MARRNKEQRRRAREQKAQQRRDRDAEYRDALGVDPGGDLPKSMGTNTSAGGGRNRRGQVTGGVGESADKRRAAAANQRARLIG